MGEWDEMKVSDAIRYLREKLDHAYIGDGWCCGDRGGGCELCKCADIVENVIAKADRMYRSEKSMVTERVRRENEELKMRLRITTDLLEGRTPTI